MEKRLLLAAALSLAVLILWGWLGPKPPARPVSARPTAAPVAAQAPASEAPRQLGEADTEPLPPPVGATEEGLTTLENGVLRATFSNRGAVLTSLVLLRYTDEQDHPLELLRRLPAIAPKPFALDFEGKPEVTSRASAALFAVGGRSNKSVQFRYADASLAISKEIALTDGYAFNVKFSVVGAPFTAIVGTGLRNPTDREKASTYVKPATAVATVGGRLETTIEGKAEHPLTWQLDAGGFAGIEDNYFLLALLPRQVSTARVLPLQVRNDQGKTTSEIALGLTGSGELDARAYFGPKEIETLESLKAGLERTVNFGWFPLPLIARPLYWLLKKTFSFVGNYGLAIILVTLMLRILLFPLMHKSYVSMKKMQKLAPKMNAIRDKYKKAKTDTAQRQKMNQEVMALYQAEGVNPMGGCLPILLQMPILFAFYYVLSQTIELRHAPFFLWIRDLSAVDSSYVLVILMTVTMYVQQAMTPSTADPAQKRIFMFMPLMMGFFMRLAPSGLVLYWLFSNVLSIAQQVIINRIGNKDEPAAQKPKRLKQARA
ncbi:MAG TPA: membrane protein insertase YidC [Thermoanaerobaculia bacterium]|nr:membrane protein insertase YidC [Thermoanaerobaculia bacterium]